MGIPLKDRHLAYWSWGAGDSFLEEVIRELSF